MRKIDFNINFDKYLIDSGAHNYNADVIEYSRSVYYKMRDFEREKYLKFFNNNDIKMTDFLNVLMSRSQAKLQETGSEVLDSKEMNKVFSDLLVFKEFLDFLIQDKMSIESITPKGDFVYTVGEEVRNYFKDKYDVDL